MHSPIHFAFILILPGFTEAFLRCDTRCDRRETGKTPNRSHVAPHATDAIAQLGHRMPSQKLSLAQLLRCDAMRQAIWCTILTFSTAKLYKGARVALKFLQVVSNRANIMVTYPNQQNFVASLTSSVNGISRVRIAQFASHASIADRVASRVASQKSFCESRLKRDSQKLFCDATRDATGAKPGKPQIAAMSRPTQLPQLGHRRS